jgi:hypothetical protein
MCTCSIASCIAHLDPRIVVQDNVPGQLVAQRIQDQRRPGSPPIHHRRRGQRRRLGRRRWPWWAIFAAAAAVAIALACVAPDRRFRLPAPAAARAGPPLHCRRWVVVLLAVCRVCGIGKAAVCVGVLTVSKRVDTFVEREGTFWGPAFESIARRCFRCASSSRVPRFYVALTSYLP